MPSPRPGTGRPATFETLESRVVLSAVAGADPATLAVAGFAPVQWEGRETFARPGEWILRLDAAAGSSAHQVGAVNKLLARAGADLRATRHLGRDGLVLLQSPHDAAHADLTARLSRLPGFRFLEPNFVMSAATTPNDPSFGNLWGLHNTGQTGGTPDADIDAPEAWERTTGDARAVVGVIDTGIDYTHPDLAGNVWTNPGETAGDGVDNDGNGYVDDVHGYDFVSNDGNPMDDQGHGTHVAGTIAAAGNNGTGVAGVNWNGRVMALKFLDASGYGTGANAIRALNYATEMRRRGVDVVATNNSYGGEPYSQAFRDAVAASADPNGDANPADGILFVAAAGNGDWLGRAVNNDATVYYPAGYDEGNVISVTATDHNDAKAFWANYGATSVDLGAPGVNISSLAVGGGYKLNSGTSMAAPHVAGAAALAWSLSPGSSWVDIKNAILGGVDAVSSLAGKTVTGGRLNLNGMLARLPVGIPAVPTGLAATPTSGTSADVVWDDVAGETGYTLERSTDATFPAGSTTAVPLAGNVTRYSDAGLSALTTYHYRVRATNGTGTSDWSAVADVATPEVSAPNAPTNLVALATAAGGISLTWADNAGDETGFTVERSTTHFADAAATVTVALAANVTSYSDAAGIVPGTTYSYRVYASSAAGDSAASNTATATAAAPVGTGTGLRGDYYDNMLTEGTGSAYTLSGLKFTRTDPTVNFNWGTGGPALNSKTKLAADTFTVKWTGAVQPRFTEDYVFRFEPDDGVGMWITVDGTRRQLWGPTWDRLDGKSGDKTSSEYANTSPHESDDDPAAAPLRLEAGKRYAIEVVYYEHTGGASAKLLWRSPSQPQEVVPASQLYYAPTALSAAAASATQVQLTWADNAGGGAAFKVERSTNGSTWAQVATTSAGATGALTAAPAAGTTYHYRVRAYAGTTFNSAYSNVATFKASATQTAAASVATVGPFAADRLIGDPLADPDLLAL